MTTVTKLFFTSVLALMLTSFARAADQRMDDYGKHGKVAWVYRHFPIDEIHPKARKETIQQLQMANQP